MTRITTEHLRERFSAHEPRIADSSGRTEAAVAIVLAPRSAAQLDVLFIKRAEVEGDPWSGQMAFPGGRREDGDADLLATAQRETLEETGVVLPEALMLGSLDDLAPLTPVLPPILVRPFVFSLPHKPAVSASPEVAQYVWAPLDALPTSVGDTDIRLRGVARTMPAYLVGPHVVWGMTHRILNSLLDLAL